VRCKLRYYARCVSTRRYYWYQAVSTATLFQAVYFVYYAERAGLSLAVILALQSFNTALRAGLDLPFGALADRVSRRLCLVAASGAILLGAAVLLAWPSLPGAWIAETVFAFAAALRSGADSALLHDALRTAGRLEEYPHAESRGQAFASLGSGAAAVLGGMLAGIDLALPYVATLATAGAGAALAWTLEEHRAGDRAFPAAAAPGRMRAAVRLAWRTPAIRWTLGVAVLAVTSSHVYFYLQQPYLRAAGVPLALFGVVFAATKLVTAAVAASAHRVEATRGQRAAVALMVAVPACGLGAMAAVRGPLGAFLILTRGLLDGLWMPLVNVFMNRLVDSRLRATMLSLQSVLARLGLSATLAGLGVATARMGLPATLALTAAAVALAGSVLLMRAPRTRRADHASVPA
jgi:MFS family permease